MIEVQAISPLRDDVRALVAELDHYMAQMYPSESNHFDPVETLVHPSVYFVGLFDGETLCAIGAVKAMNDDGIYAEVKRVYVTPNYRGNGLAKAMMEALEDYLVKTGIYTVRLETGIYQPEAVGLYEKLGYQKRGQYGAYDPDPLSVFMEKQLLAKT